MAFNYLSSMPPLQAGRCPYTMPAHMVSQMSVPQVAFAPSATGLNGHVHPTRRHNSEASLPQGFTSYDLSVCANAGATSLAIDRNYSMMNRQAGPLSELCMYSIQPGCEVHTSHGHYENGSLGYGQTVQCYPLPPQTLIYTQESGSYSKGMEEQSPSFTGETESTETWSSEQVKVKSSHEKTATQNIFSHCNVSQDCTQSSKRKKSTDSLRTRTHKKVRYIKDGCSFACQRRCKQKISQETRNELFAEFWRLESDAERKTYIAHHAIKLPMMTCKEGSKRSTSIDWAFSVQGESFSVCKRFFLHTLDVPEELAYAAVKESQHSYEGAPVKINLYAKKQNCSSPGWIETDIDEYNAKKVEINAHRKQRYERKERIPVMKPGCKEACRRCCQSKFSYEQRLAIFNGYRSLSNLRKQREFLQVHVKRLERRDIKNKNGSRGGCSIQWQLDKGKESIPVCKTFFLHTVGISEHTAYSNGLQNDILPAEKIKYVKKAKTPSWISMKNKCIKAMLAKGRTCALLAKFGKKSIAISAKTCKKSNKIKNIIPSNEICSNTPGNIINTFYSSDTDTFQEPKTSVPNLLISHHASADILFDTLSKPFFDQDTCTDHTCATSQTSNQVLGQGNSNCSELQCDQTRLTLQHYPGIQTSYNPPSVSVTGNLNVPNDVTLESQPLMPISKERNSPILGVNDVLLLKTLQNTRDDIFLSPSQSASFETQWKTSNVNTQKEYVKRDPTERSTGRHMKSGCSDSCRRKCNIKISRSHREELFIEFWQLENDTLRREFILPLVNKIPKKSGKKSESRRSCTLQWTIPYEEELMVVCKKFFLDTFDIRDNFVRIQCMPK